MFRSGKQKRAARGKAVAVAIGATVTASAVIGVPHAVANPAAADTTRTISSIAIKGFPLPATPTVTVTGKGSGAAPTKGTSPSTFPNCGGSGTGQDYGPSKLWLLDASRSSGPGLLGALQEGANATKTYGNCGESLSAAGATRRSCSPWVHATPPGRPPWRLATTCASRSRVFRAAPNCPEGVPTGLRHGERAGGEWLTTALPPAPPAGVRRGAGPASGGTPICPKRGRGWCRRFYNES